MEFPGTEGKLMCEIAIANGCGKIAEWLDIQMHGEKRNDGGRIAKSLQSLCRGVIRSTLALGATNIYKIWKLQYPKLLKIALMLIDEILE